MAASIASLRRPAFVKSGPRRGRAPLRVVAFRDTHRAKQLVDTATEFATAWATGHIEGPSDSVMYSLKQICDEQVRVQASHPMGCISIKGLDGVRAKLARHQETAADLSTPAHTKAEVVLAAANDNTDTAFALVRLPAIDGQSAAETYMLLKMEVLLDDGTRQVVNVVERGQLSNAFESPERKQEPTSKKSAAPFPRELLQHWANRGGDQKGDSDIRLPKPDMVEGVKAVLKAWTQARNSGADVWAMMDQAGCDQDFKLIDGHGTLLPRLGQASDTMAIDKLQSQAGSSGMPESPAPSAAHQQSSGPEQGAVLSRKEMREVLEATKAVYDVNCQLVDTAICLDEAAAFTHWKSTQKNRITGVDWVVEGMEVDIMDPHTGGLKAVFLFRDSMDFEEQQQMANVSGGQAPGQKAAA